MISRLTTIQFYEGLKQCSACTVDGWPAVVEWAKKLPRTRQAKPYAIFKWTEFDGDKSRTVFCDLRQDQVSSLEVLDVATVRVHFLTGEEPIEVRLLEDC